MTKTEFLNNKNYYEFKLGLNEPVYECPKCGGDVYRDISVVYMSYPPKYKYYCLGCGHAEIF